MAKAKRHSSSYTSGVIDPKLRYRTDFEAFYSSAQKIENWDVLRFGGLDKSKGTKFVSASKYPDRQHRIIPFQYSGSDNLHLEFGHEYIRFILGGALVASGAEIYELATSYQEYELLDIHVSSLNNFVYLTHENHPPALLERISNSNWVISEIDWTYPPLLNINAEDITLELSGTTGTGVTLSSSQDLFAEDHVGAHFELSHPRTDNVIQASHDSFTSGTQPTEGIDVYGEWSLTSTSTTTTTLEIERSVDGGATWVVFRSYSSQGAAGFEITSSGTEEERGVKYRLNWTRSGTGYLKYNFFVQDAYKESLVKITSFTDAQNVTVDVINDAESTDPTKIWKEGAFSDHQGYPAAVTILNDRLFLAGTKEKGKTVWGSRLSDFTDFKLGEFDDDAVMFTISSGKDSSVRWMEGQNGLLIGTSISEFAVNSGLNTGAITPSNIISKYQSNRGSSSLQPILAGDVLVYGQKQGTVLRQFYYYFNEDKYQSPDLTSINSIVGKGGIKQIDLRTSPYITIYAVNGIGEIWKLVFDRDENIQAWCSRVTDGEFESLSISSTDSGDEIMVSVKREINGSTVRYNEQILTDEFESQAEWWYLDSALELNNGDPVAIQSFSAGLFRADGHGFEDGETIRIYGTEEDDIDAQEFLVANSNANYFGLNTLQGSAINSDDWVITEGFAEDVSSVITGLDHLEGKTVGIFGDGSVQDEKVVSGGSITLDRYVNRVVIGLPYTSICISNELILPEEAGKSVGAEKSITNIYVALEDTLDLEVAQNGLESSVALFDLANFKTGSSPDPFTGIKSITPGRLPSKSCQVKLVSSKPVKSTVLSVTTEYDQQG